MSGLLLFVFLFFRVSILGIKNREKPRTEIAATRPSHIFRHSSINGFVRHAEKVFKIPDFHISLLGGLNCLRQKKFDDMKSGPWKKINVGFPLGEFVCANEFIRGVIG